MFPVVPTEPGVTRRVLAHSPDLMLVSFCFEEGAEGSLHHHPHIQGTYVRTGRFRFIIGGHETAIGPGDSLTIPSNVEHGCICLEAGELIDAFTPRRDEFL
jgi:unsaturated pyranuronate lyase